VRDRRQGEKKKEKYIYRTREADGMREKDRRTGRAGQRKKERLTERQWETERDGERHKKMKR
jgi:hypothetical protein